MAVNLTIRRGETFNYTFRWMCEPLRFIHIDKVSTTMPIIVTATNHNLLTGTPVDLVKVTGKTQDTVAESLKVIYVDDSTIQLDTDEVGLKAFKNADYLRCYSYVNLTNLTARCYFKQKAGSPILFELTTENGRIVVDEDEHLITMTIPARVTAALGFNKGKYDLELVQGNTVVRIIEGDFTVENEITVRDEEIGEKQSESVSFAEALTMSDNEAPEHQVETVSYMDGLKLAGV